MARFLLALAATLALAACGVGGPAYAPPPRDATPVVMSGGLRFEPATVRVRVGDTVEWRNQSIFTHTATADPARAADAADVALPAGAAPFDTGPVAPGEVARVTFTVPGTYAYVCVPHERLGMKGTVIVDAAE